MREGPILFKGEMVLAIFDDRKRVTRRVVNEDRLKVKLLRRIRSDVPPTYHADPGVYRAKLNQNGAVSINTKSGWLGVKPSEFDWVSPFGGAGDRLWVRETFYCDHFEYPNAPIDEMKPLLDYRATHDCGHWEAGCPCRDDEGRSSWRPSIFMPRWACRLLLDVVSVRVERLQEITEQDVHAEGCVDHEGDPTDSLAAFRGLWNGINAKRGFGWNTNPFVWRVEFKRSDDG